MEHPDLIEKRSFAPIAGPRTRVLILGSLPGEASLKAGQYYANPRNQFWSLIGAVLGVQLPEPYHARLEALQSAGIGLWDVIQSARRRGSLDSAILGHVANPLLELVRSLPDLQIVAFNGGKAAAIGRSELTAIDPSRLIDLPSSSPAYTLGLAKKQERWLALQPFLTPLHYP